MPLVSVKSVLASPWFIRLGLPGAIVLLDQLSKRLCTWALNYADPVTLLPGLDLLLIYNTGAAFSFLSDAGGWQRWTLAAISAIVSIVILVWLWRLPARDKWLACALALILGGALGNLIDRFLLGYVVDFISVYYQTYRFPTFNLADAAISIGAALMVLDLFRSRAA